MRQIYWSFDKEIGCWSSPIYPVDPPGGETFDSVLSRYKQHREQFLASQSWASLEHIISRHLSPRNEFKNAVCIALGSLSSVGQKTGTLNDRTRSLLQLACFVCMVGLMEITLSGFRPKATTLQMVHRTNFEKRRASAYQMIAQEPRLNDLDKQLLRHLGIRIVASPGIWSRITKRPMVYMPGAEAAHFFKVSTRNPAMWWPVRLPYLSYVKQ